MERGEYVEAETELNELGFAPNIIAQALKDFTTKEQAIMKAVELIEKEDEVPANQIVPQPHKKKREPKDPQRVKGKVPKEKKKQSEKILGEMQGLMQPINEGEDAPKEAPGEGENSKAVLEGEKEEWSEDSDDEEEWTSDSDSLEYQKLVD